MRVVGALPAGVLELRQITRRLERASADSARRDILPWLLSGLQKRP